MTTAKGLFTWREGAPANRASRGGLTSHTFLSKTHRSVYMLDREARLPGGPCLLARGTRLARRGSFLPCKRFEPAISANRGEINRENMAARSEYLHSYRLPVLSAEQNDSQSEEINVKSFLGRPLCLLCFNGRSRDNARSPLTVPVR